jgi:superfamily II DNA or RNA helicase
MIVHLRDYQKKLIERVRDSYRAGFRAPLVVLPTGGGKTFVFAYITYLMYAKGKRVTILAHRDSIMRQIHDALTVLQVPHGIIASGRTAINQQVNVASVYTYARRTEQIISPDLFIIDEAHHVRASTWKKIIKASSRARLLGVTATPIRLDGLGLGVSVNGFFDQLIEGPDIRWMIKNNFLCDYDYYSPVVRVDESKLTSSGSDYSLKKLNEIYNKPVIIADAVGKYNSICPGEPGIAFCVSIDHAEETARAFNQAGFSAMALHSGMSYLEIRSAIKALAERRIDLLTSCDIISEGTDIPAATVALLMRKTQSTGLYLQQVGRVLRFEKNKTAKILDLVGNRYIHGLPDDTRVWSLDQKRKKKNSTPVLSGKRECPRCNFVFNPQPTCPRCGFIYTPAGRDLEVIEGELIKEQQEQQRQKEQEIKIKKLRERAHATTLEELLKIEKQRGYKNGWARIIWNNRHKRKQKVI